MTNKKFLSAMLAAALILGIVLAGCSAPNDDEKKDDWGSIEYPESLTINSDSKGAKDTLISEGEVGYEATALAINQVIPDFAIASSGSSSLLMSTNTSRAVNEGYITSRSAGAKTWPANSPIIVFFDDIIYLESIQDNFEIFVGSGDNKERVYGTIAISASPDNKGNLRAILTFSPYKPFAVNKGVTITIKKGLKDKCGNGMSKDTVIGFTAEQPKAQGSFTKANWGFEAGMAGIEITGDGAIFEGNGTLVPHSGGKLAAISTGNSYYNSVAKKYVSILSDTPSIEDKSSLLKLGPIDTNFSKVSLWYDFISAEFDDYAPSVYDDQAVITIYGPKGAVSKTLTSINTIGKIGSAKQYSGTLKMPDAGDSFAGQTGWTEFVLEDVDVGTPAHIIFTVSDITDTIFSTILAVDDIELTID